MTPTPVRTDQDVEELMELLPSEASYWRGVRQGSGVSARLAEVNLWAEASNNPGFGYLFIKNFVDLRRPLPTAIYATELLRGQRRALRLWDWRVCWALALTRFWP
jgi:hypothetical protein